MSETIGKINRDLLDPKTGNLRNSEDLNKASSQAANLQTPSTDATKVEIDILNTIRAAKRKPIESIYEARSVANKVAGAVLRDSVEAVDAHALDEARAKALL